MNLQAKIRPNPDNELPAMANAIREGSRRVEELLEVLPTLPLYTYKA